MASSQDVLLRGQPEPAPDGITHGIQLTPENTGAAAGTTFTTWGGNENDQTNDWSFTNMRFPSQGVGVTYTFGGNNDVFTNCKFEAGVLFALADNLTLINCTFDGGVAFSSCYGVDMTGCHVLNGSDLMHITGDQPGRSQCLDITITETLVEDPAPVAADHTDGLQVRGCDGLTLTRCALDMGPWFQVGGQDVLNSAFFPEGGNGGNANIQLTDCYLNGGGYTVVVRPATGTFQVTGCKFGPDAHYGLVTRDNGGGSQVVTQSNNTRVSDGTTVTI